MTGQIPERFDVDLIRKKSKNVRHKKHSPKVAQKRIFFFQADRQKLYNGMKATREKKRK